MLRAVLEAANYRGDWLYMVTGQSGSLGNPSQYCLEVRLASEVVTSMVCVVMRASLGPGGTLIGMLRLPPEVLSSELIESLKLPVSTFNHSGWHGILTPEVREQAFYVGKPLVTTPLKPAMRGARESDDDSRPPARVAQLDGPTYLARERARTLPIQARARPDPLPRAPTKAVVFSASRPEISRVDIPVQPKAAPQPEFPTIGSPAPTAKQEAVMPDSTTEHHDRLAQFLRQVLSQDSVINGVFSGTGVTKYSQPLFPSAPVIWQRMGILRELVGLKWIRRVGHGEYQVEQSFVTKHGLSISLAPRDKAARGDKRKQPKPNGHTQNGGGLQALLDEAATLNARIREEAEREEHELEVLLVEAQAAVVRAQAEVAERQAALDAFKARLSAVLVAPGAVAPSVSATGP